jgi:hypothetical protein
MKGSSNCLLHVLRHHNSVEAMKCSMDFTEIILLLPVSAATGHYQEDLYNDKKKLLWIHVIVRT